MRGDLCQNYVSNCVNYAESPIFLTGKFFFKDIGAAIELPQKNRTEFNAGEVKLRHINRN